MKSEAEALQFAIGFAQLDLGKLREGDRLNLIDDLHKFLGVTHSNGQVEIRRFWGSVIAYGTDAPTTDDFKALQRETRSVLDEIIEFREIQQGRKKMDQEFLGRTLHGLEVRYNLTFLPLALDEWVEQRVMAYSRALVIKGTTRDVFLVIFHSLLIREGTERILKCPECGKLFYRIGRKKYCSRTCVNRVNVRRYRNKQVTS